MQTGEFPKTVQALSLGKDRSGEEYSDGTKRKARRNQIKAIDWIKKHKKAKNKFIIAPTGAGKSFIARNQTREPGTVVVVPNNYLMDQYVKEYPEYNFLKGASHYQDKFDYLESKRRLWQGEPTVANIHSWVIWEKYSAFMKRPDWGDYCPTKLLVIDEFHNLYETLIGMESGHFTRKTYPGLPITDKITNLLEYFSSELRSTRDRIKELDQDDPDRETLLLRTYRLSSVCKGLRDSEDSYVIEPSQKYRFVKVTRYEPSEAAQECFTSYPLIALSATPRPLDIEFLGSGEVLNLPSEIPVKQRQIHRKIVPFKMNRHNTVSDIKPYIDEILMNHRGQNGVVHTTYGRQVDFENNYPNWYFHSSDTKGPILDQFKKNGGILCASGCSEGIDLPDELARFQIIPWMVKPNLGDLWVKHRMAKRDGREWYDWKVMITFAQMAGRSTRSKTDMSTIYTFDPYLITLYERYEKKIWKWFKESLVLFKF